MRAADVSTGLLDLPRMSVLETVGLLSYLSVTDMHFPTAVSVCILSPSFKTNLYSTM